MGDETSTPQDPEVPEKRKRGRPRKVPPAWAATPPVPEPAPTEFACDGCRQAKPFDAFKKFVALEDPNAVCLCDHCATYGAPLENPLAELTPMEVRALDELAAGGSMRRASAIMGLSEQQMRQYLAGKEKPVIRAAYQKLLLQIGVTPDLIAHTIHDALRAEKVWFDKDGREAGREPDHAVRLKAAGMAQKVLTLEQPAELTRRAPDEDPSTAWAVETTLGDGKSNAQDAYWVPYEEPRQLKDVN